MAVGAVVLGPFAATAATAAHVYRFHLVRSSSSSQAAIIQKCEGSALLFPWNGRRYQPAGKVVCLLSDGDDTIGWRQLTIHSTYRLPPPVGRLEARWVFVGVAYHAVSATLSYCVPGHERQPNGCRSRTFREKGSQWGNVW